jgi:hypothetical protein
MLQGAQQLPICLLENKLNVIRYLTVVLKCKVIKKKYSEPKNIEVSTSKVNLLNRTRNATGLTKTTTGHTELSWQNCSHG